MWILDGLVLDLEPFVSQHPGGAFFLDQTVGTDISKYFHGLDIIGPNEPNIHSNAARKIA